jgi:hypothetical protein
MATLVILFTGRFFLKIIVAARCRSLAELWPVQPRGACRSACPAAGAKMLPAILDSRSEKSQHP